MSRTRARASSPLRGSSPHTRISNLQAPEQPAKPDAHQHVGNYLATSGDCYWPLTLAQLHSALILLYPLVGAHLDRCQ